MAKIPYEAFVGDSAKMRSSRFNDSRTINMYLEANESVSPAKGKQPAVLLSVPGKTLRFDSGISSGVRGMWQPSSNPGVAFVVIGNVVFKIAPGTDAGGLFNSTILMSGTLNSSTGQVSISDNGLQVFMVDGQDGYWWDIGGDTVNLVTDVHFHPASTVDYLDGRFVFNHVGTTECFFSDINAVTFSELNTFRKTSSSDNVIGIKVNVGQIYLFGEKNTEVWYNQGSTESVFLPYARVQGKYIPFGCCAPLTIQTLNGTIVWLGKSIDGKGVVYTLDADNPTRVSTHAVEFDIQRVTDLSQAHAYTQQIDGHMFYCLQIPELDKTWCFDLLKPNWHERQTCRDGFFGRDRANNHMLFNGEHIVGDDQTGKLFVLDFDTYTDGEYPLVRIRQAPHLVNELDRVRYNKLEVDFMFGVGTPTEFSANPVAVLNISDDGGMTFGPDLEVSIGAIGDYQVRAQWWQLGMSTDRVFRVTISDPVNVQMLSAVLDITPCNS